VNSNHRKQLEKLSLEVIAARREGPLFYRLAGAVCERAGLLPTP
jgi:hypothetical protein